MLTPASSRPPANHRSPVELQLLSGPTYRRMRTEQQRHEAERGVHDDAVFAGFCYGVLAAMLGFGLLSGGLLQLVVGLVRSILTVGGPS